jgi:hypothetical protein
VRKSTNHTTDPALPQGHSTGRILTGRKEDLMLTKRSVGSLTRSNDNTLGNAVPKMVWHRTML